MSTVDAGGVSSVYPASPTRGPETARRPDIVLGFAWETWTAAVFRGLSFSMDRLVLSASASDDIGRLLVADPWRSAPAAAFRHLQGRRTPALPAHEPASASFRPFRLARRDPTDARDLERAYASYGRRLARSVDLAGMTRPALVTASPFVAAHASLDWASTVTYYGYDDWGAQPMVEPWWPLIEDAYRVIRERGHRVVGVSQAVIDRIQPLGPSLVVPNGLAPEEWSGPATVPSWFEALPGPRVLYLGSISDRLDLGQLRAAAQAVPDGTIVLVGWVVAPEVRSELDRIPNLVLEAPVDRPTVVGLMRRADVCIMPHRRTRLTEAMSPLKLYEYLAAGRPTVVTDLPPVRDVDPSVALVEPGDEQGFGDAVRQAVQAPGMSEDDRRRFVLENSWEHRHRTLLDFALAPESTETH